MSGIKVCFVQGQFRGGRGDQRWNHPQCKKRSFNEKLILHQNHKIIFKIILKFEPLFDKHLPSVHDYDVQIICLNDLNWRWAKSFPK